MTDESVTLFEIDGFTIGCRFNLPPRDGAYHRAGVVVVNGVLQPGSELHWYRVNDSWQLELLRLPHTLLTKIGSIRVDAFSKKIREFEITNLDEKPSELASVRLMPATEIRREHWLAAAIEEEQSAGEVLGLDSTSASSKINSEGESQADNVGVATGAGFGFTPYSFGFPNGVLGATSSLGGQRSRLSEPPLSIVSRIAIDADEWAHPWSIRTWRNTLYECARAHELKPTTVDLMIVRQVSLETTIEEALTKQRALANYLLTETTARCRATLDAGTLVEYFDFPTLTRAACEQYLAYFSQFLRDLGIESDTQVREEANRVLFSVTPKDGVEALSAVREALAVFLKLPALQDEERRQLVTADVATMQLEANVQHLRSQIYLAQATIQMQAATLEAKSQTIDAQAITIQALQPRGQPDRLPDSEPLIGNNVRVTKVKKFGIEVDMPNIVRSLKRRTDK